MDKDILYYIWLAEAFPYGSIKPKQIIQCNESLKNFYELKNKSLDHPFLLKNDIDNLEKKKPKDYINLIEMCKNKHINIVCFGDDAYPKRLREIDSPPMVFYYSGDLSCLDEKCVGIVGTRKVSDYGAAVTFKTASELARREITVVSGCAKGTDSYAHKGAMESGKTVAVLGTSLDSSYPSGSANMKRRIVRSGGVVLTEYPPGYKISRGAFPVRNRIIVGLSDIILVTEAPAKSGACITANLAAEYGKDLFCLPPRDITNPKYDGVKKFIREGCRVLLGAEDILEYYRFSSSLVPEFKTESKPKREPSKQKIDMSDFSDEAKKIYAVFDKSEDVESLMKKTEFEINEILTAMTELEIMGVLGKKGTKFYLL